MRHLAFRGNESGIGYKIVQDNGRRTGGYSSFAVKDNYHYYWLWDVNDLARVRAGNAPPCPAALRIRIFRAPFAGSSNCLEAGRLMRPPVGSTDGATRGSPTGDVCQPADRHGYHAVVSPPPQAKTPSR